jgi:hypothetical protein
MSKTTSFTKPEGVFNNGGCTDAEPKGDASRRHFGEKNNLSLKVAACAWLLMYVWFGRVERLMNVSAHALHLSILHACKTDKKIVVVTKLFEN